MLVTRSLIANVAIFLSMLRSLPISEATGAIFDPCDILSIEVFRIPPYLHARTVASAIGILRLFYDITEYAQDVIIYLKIHVRGFRQNYR